MGGVELVSYGDRLEPGCYGLHSRFERAANYRDDERVVCLVDRFIGGGPNNIVLGSGMPLNDDPVVVGEDFVEMGGRSIPLDRVNCYSSCLSVTRVSRTGLCTGLAVMKNRVIELAPEGSISFLLEESADTSAERAGNTGFDEAVRLRIEEGWRLFRSADYARGTSLLVGCGRGLTPAGDDFIAGYLSGLHLEERLYGESRSEIRGQIYGSTMPKPGTGTGAGSGRAIGGGTGATNILSRTFIRYAYEGCFYERAKLLINSVVAGESMEIEERCRDMIDLGETSGTDFAVGFLCSLSIYE